MNYVRRLHTRGSSDPEAVSGSSTKIEVKIAYLGDFLFKKCPRRAVFDDFVVENTTKSEDPVTARKTGSSVWSVELYFGIDVCFWPLDNIFIQKLPL